MKPPPSGAHQWTVPDDNGRSSCTKGCGVYRLLNTASRAHQALYSRSPSLRTGTWGALMLACSPQETA